LTLDTRLLEILTNFVTSLRIPAVVLIGKPPFASPSSMKRLAALLLPLLSALPAHAFMPYSDLLTVSPAFVRAGDTVEVTVAGKDLEAISGLRFSNAKITAKPVVTPADDFFPTPRPVEGKFTVTIPADVPPGVYEVRTVGFLGLSTARPFLVFPSGSSESLEQGDHSTPETALPLAAGAGTLGTLDAGKFDWYRFEAKKGERFLLEVMSERLDANGDVLLAVADAAGSELESSRHHFGRDPFIDFTAPADGSFFVSLCDSLYGGGREHFYHLRLGRGPHVDFVFPPAGEPGKKRSFTLFGRNLPGGSLGDGWRLKGKPLETLSLSLDVPAEVTIPKSFHSGTPREAMVPSFEHTIAGADPVRIGFATAPVVEEEKASEIQKVTLPAEIAGRFDEAGDGDAFRVSLKKGETCWIEVYSHRLGVSADPIVTVEKIAKDAAGTETFTAVAENDDLPSFYGPDTLDDLNADSLDPALSITADADGDYRITLLNQAGGGSAAHVYRLAIRRAMPDFQLLVGTELAKTINNDAFPSVPVLRRGGSVIYRVVAYRRDGFEGDITVTAQGLPPGVVADPLVLSGKTAQGFLTLRATPEVAEWQGPVRISGKSPISGVEVTREARSASIVWGKRVFGNQAQVRSRLDLETVLSVVAEETEPTRIDPKENKVWSVEIGQSLEIPIKLTETGTRTGSLAVNVHGFPGLLRNPPTVAINEGQTEGVLKFDFKPSANFTPAPGRYQFVLQGVGNTKYRLNPATVVAATKEADRIKGLRPGLAENVAKAKTALTDAEKALAAAKEREAAAADDAARGALKGTTTAAQAKADAAKKSIQESEAKLAALGKAEEAANKAVTAAETKAKERSQPFGTYSMPITVEVTEVKKK